MNQIVLFQNISEIAQLGLPENVVKYFQTLVNDDKYGYDYFGFEGHFYLVKLGKLTGNAEAERLRVEGSRIAKSAADLKITNLQVIYNGLQVDEAFFLAEGFLLKYIYTQLLKSIDLKNQQFQMRNCRCWN